MALLRAMEAQLRAHTLVFDPRHVDTIVLAWAVVVDRGAPEARLMGDFLIRDGVERRLFWLRTIHAVFGADTEVQVSPGMRTELVSLAATDVSLRWRAGGAGYEVHTCPEVDGDWYLRRTDRDTGRLASWGASSGSTTSRSGSRARAPGAAA